MKRKVILGSIFLVMTAAISFFLKDKAPLPPETPKEVGAASKALDVDKMWRQKIEESMLDQGSELSNKIEELKKELANPKPNHELYSLQEKIKFLEAELAEKPDLTPTEKVASPPQISKYIVPLTNPKNAKDYQPTKTAENYITSGSFAKGVLLSGLDVSTAVKTVHDPEPVLIKVTDHGTLPRSFKSDLKDCHIIGAAYGDLSSERAKVRIEKLSCTEVSSGEIIETEISGYIAGEDGRSGLRGIVVSVDQKYLANAQIFGTLSGITNSYAPVPKITNMGAVLPEQQKLSGNMLKGASSSLDKLAEYYIERAESIQPVIQISAGREIDVIFTEGVYFGTTHLKLSLAKKREERLKRMVEEQ